MCGIAGWVDLKRDISQYQNAIENMTETLKYRGPDASGIYTSTNVLLGHRRLAVVDIEGGVQPMTRKIGNREFVLIYNGELYNTEDIRKELLNLGYKFNGHSDTEVLLVSYIEWGHKCVHKLNGIFAFAVWDSLERTLFMARDRFGVKPLFYGIRDNALIFASELKAILKCPKVSAEINELGLSEIFCLGPARTPGVGVFKDINELRPAHYLTFSEKGLKIQKYWSLESRPHEDTYEQTVEKVRYLVLDTIERQLISDVPICTFLSGGLDSSAITAAAAKHFKDKGLGQLHTYSIDYVDNDKYFKPSLFQPNPDAPWVKLMTEAFDTKHHYYTIDTPQLVEALRGALEARDLPGMADIDSSLLCFCKEIKKDHVVSLSGECADEVFGGYPWFHNQELLDLKTFPWSKSMEERKRVLSPELLDLIRPEEYVEQRYLDTLKEVPKLIGEDSLEAKRRQMFYLNINWFMSTLLERKDRMSMGAGLEVRVPFCDHRLVQYVWNIPWSMKTVGGREKGILREALKDILPEEIIYRKKSPYPKTHNPVYEKAVSQWLTQIIDDSSSPLLSFIDVASIKSMLNRTSDYGKPWFGQLMATPQMFAYLIQIDMWMRKYQITVV